MKKLLITAAVVGLCAAAAAAIAKRNRTDENGEYVVYGDYLVFEDVIG